MRDDKFDLYDDEVLKNLEKLKAKYSDYGVDDEDIEIIGKNIKRSAPEYNAFEEDFADGFPEKTYDEEDAESESDFFSYDDEPEQEEYSPEQISVNDEEGIQYAAKQQSSSSDIYFSGAEAPVQEEPIKRAPIPGFEAPNVYFPSATEEQQKKQKKKASKNKKRKKKSHKLRNTILVLFILAVIWGAFFGIDYVLAYNWKDPLFCKKTTEYENGSVDFVGAFYKIQFHVDENGDVSSVCLPWFTPGPNEGLEKKAEKSDSEQVSKNSDDIEYGEGNSSIIEVTIPEKYLDMDTANGLELTEGQVQQGFKSVTLNKNGSATYKIGDADYQRVVGSTKATVGENLKSIATDEDYPSIKKVEYNDDFSVITLYVEKDKYLNSFDTFIEEPINIWVGYYNSFAQNKDAKCEIILKDIADNSVIEKDK